MSRLSSFPSALPPRPEGAGTLSRLELRCPPLPQTLLEALSLLHVSDTPSVKQVTAMVEHDPIVVARLLQSVNSAYYGLRRQISSVDRAVVMLGPVPVVGIVVGLNMMRLRSVLDGPARPCFLRLIRHATATAHLMRYLLESSRMVHPHSRVTPGLPYTAGLLHDFGKIILVYNYPEKAVAFYDEQALAEAVRTSTVQEMEQLLFGYDHTEAGEYAAYKLSFPDILAKVIRFHHAPEDAPNLPEIGPLLRTLTVANRAADLLGYGLTPPTMTWDNLIAHPDTDRLTALDFPAFGTTQALVESLQAQHEEVETYMQSLPG